MNKIFKISAFTLAEILITLLVISILASLTIPALLNEIRDEEFHTAWRKSYAEISAAFNRAKMDNGGTLLGVCEDDDNDCLRNLVMPYLSYAKSCNNSSSGGSNLCIYNTYSLLRQYCGIYYQRSWTVSGLILNNGYMLIFGKADKSCDYSYSSSNVKFCGWFMVDINGIKGPNMVGRDLYHGWIVPEGVLPAGAFDQNSIAASYNLSSCDKSNSTAEGWGCSAKFLTQ